ncbi:MAG: hypothetical protein AB1Z19_06340 [Eubacteriales bacterium]
MMKKFIAPLLFGVLFLGIMSAYLFIFVDAFRMPIALILYFVAVVALIVSMVVTLRARYKELKEQDEEDLKKY